MVFNMCVCAHMGVLTQAEISGLLTEAHKSQSTNQLEDQTKFLSAMTIAIGLH